jgi:hypothetical protein
MFNSFSQHKSFNGKASYGSNFHMQPRFHMEFGTVERKSYAQTSRCRNTIFVQWQSFVGLMSTQIRLFIYELPDSNENWLRIADN